MVNYTAKIMDRMLEAYFRSVLEIAALQPPPAAYRLLNSTGHLFRHWRCYASGQRPGVFIDAFNCVEAIGIHGVKEKKRFFKSYFRYESRFVIENIWLRKRQKQNIIGAFHNDDIVLLEQYMRDAHYVIVSAHTSGMYLLVALLEAINHPSPFILMNMLRQPWSSATSIQRSVIRAICEWKKHQPLFFVEDGNAMTKGRAAINNGESVFIAPDVPGYSERGVNVEFMGKQVRVAAGASRLASTTGVPMLIAIPWAPDYCSPYRIFFKLIRPSKNVEQDMIAVFKGIEAGIMRNPACWYGWIILNEMQV